MEVKPQSAKLQKAIGLMFANWMLEHCHEKYNRRKQSSKQPVSWMPYMLSCLRCVNCVDLRVIVDHFAKVKLERLGLELQTSRKPSAMDAHFVAAD